jgi:putative transposase
LRKAWNRAKHEVAPWWAQNSKEAYSCGLADLAYALSNWSDSKQGKRQGRRVGFPRFKAGRRDADRVRFTTGAMRLEPDRRTITVPVIGPLRAKGNTRRVQRHLASGRAHILNMTLSQRWGRLFVSISYALRTPTTACTVAQPAVRAGVDLGMRTLATLATVDTTTGVETLTEYPNPAPLKATLAARRRAGRQLSRRIPGSRGSRTAKAKLAHLDRRCVQLRPHRDRRPRRGRDETQHGAARLPAGRLRRGNGCDRAAVGLQVHPLQRKLGGGRSLVRIQPNPPRLHCTRRHTVSTPRPRPDRQTAGVPTHR